MGESEKSWADRKISPGGGRGAAGWRGLLNGKGWRDCRKSPILSREGPLRELEEVVLLVEEMEAVRLKIIWVWNKRPVPNGWNFRPTFQRILISARSKIAEALVKGKALRIQGEHYELARQRFQCKDAGANGKGCRPWMRMR